jgi:hypothetical protein
MCFFSVIVDHTSLRTTYALRSSGWIQTHRTVLQFKTSVRKRQVDLGQTNILGLFGFGEVRYSDDEHGPAHENDNGMQQTARHLIRTCLSRRREWQLFDDYSCPVDEKASFPQAGGFIHSHGSEDHS